MKKLISITSILFIVIATSSFTFNTNPLLKPVANSEGYYFFFSANPNKVYNGDDSKLRYISTILYYTDNGTCNDPYQKQADAKRAFGTYLKAEYDDIKNLEITQVGDFYMEKKYSSKTMQDAKEKQNQYITDEKAKGNTVVKTNFSYSCN